MKAYHLASDAGSDSMTVKKINGDFIEGVQWTLAGLPPAADHVTTIACWRPAAIHHQAEANRLVSMNNMRQIAQASLSNG